MINVEENYRKQTRWLGLLFAVALALLFALIAWRSFARQSEEKAAGESISSAVPAGTAGRI